MEKGTCSLEDESNPDLNSGNVDMEILSDMQVRGTTLQAIPTPTGNLSLDAEPRTPPGPELGPNTQLILPYPNPNPTPISVAHTAYYRNQPSADATVTDVDVHAHTSTSSNNGSSSRAETPRQHPHTPRSHTTQHPLVYHYPVPSYPQLGGPNALLAGYTTTYVHRPPYFSPGGAMSSSSSVAPSAAGSAAPRLGANAGVEAQGADGSHSSHIPAFSLPVLPPPPPAISALTSAS